MCRGARTVGDRAAHQPTHLAREVGVAAQLVRLLLEVPVQQRIRHRHRVREPARRECQCALSGVELNR